MTSAFIQREQASPYSLTQLNLICHVSVSQIYPGFVDQILQSSMDTDFVSFMKMTDASLHTFHVCHAVFFPLPSKDGTTSQPVKALKKSIPLVLSGLMADTSSWIGIYHMCSPLSNVTHIFSRPVAARESIRHMAITTISVSLAAIIRDL